MLVFGEVFNYNATCMGQTENDRCLSVAIDTMPSRIGGELCFGM